MKHKKFSALVDKLRCDILSDIFSFIPDSNHRFVLSNPIVIREDEDGDNALVVYAVSLDQIYLGSGSWEMVSEGYSECEIHFLIQILEALELNNGELEEIEDSE
jgi:hypothetical protein